MDALILCNPRNEKFIREKRQYFVIELLMFMLRIYGFEGRV